jgi:hypothetical protein
VIGGLAGVGLDQRWLVVTGVAVAFCGLALQVWFRMRANRLAGSLAAALAAGDRPQVFGALSGVLQDASSAEWVALVGWQEDGMGGEIQLARGDGPPEFVLMSWLVREAESRDDLLATAGHELGSKGVYVALPLRRENSALTGFLVFRAPRALRPHVASALAGSLDAIGLALAPGPEVVADEPEPAAAHA